METLDTAIEAYQTALDDLLAEGTDVLAPCVMSALLTRDRLAKALSITQPTREQMDTIVTLDQRLQKSAIRIDTTVGRSTLAAWRESVQPAASAWWWRLDERAATAEPRPSPLWAVAAGFLLTVSISLSAEIARRFLAVGPDFFGVFSTLAQGFLAYLAGRSLTEAGQHRMESFLARINVHRRYAAPATTLTALTLLLLVVGLRLSLPIIARYYNNQGVSLQRDGRVTGAIQSYQRAISLSPFYAEAHYNLGTAYEDILAYDLAMSSYQTAIRNDSQMYAAYNNLARIYIAYKNDYANALPLLDIALDLKIALPEEQLVAVRYSLFKNRGWANLGLKHLTLAEDDLRQALELRPNGAAAHCLLAQVFDAQQETKAALGEWEQCLRYEKTDVVPVEARWIAQARERLSGETPK